MKINRILHVAKKDLKDFSRDYKSIAAIILLPFIGLPGLALLTGALASQQTATLCVVFQEQTPLAKQLVSWIVDNATRMLAYQGVGTRIVYNYSGGGCDLILEVPVGFTRNVTSLNGTGLLIVNGGLSGIGQQILYAVDNAAGSVSHVIVVDRVNRLASLAGVRVNPVNFLNPIRIAVSYHTATGAPASSSQVLAARAARILAFSLFFVVNPAIVFMSDALSGERERRTIEMLLIAPLSPLELLAGKLIASAVAGLLGAVADSIGILVFFMMSGMNITVPLGLALIWVLVSTGLILFSAGLAAFISSRTGSVRSAQNMSFLATMLALSFYFAALVVDYTKLSGIIRLILEVIPYSQAALALEYYAVGLARFGLFFALAIYAWTLFVLAVTARSFKPERLLVTS